MKFQYSFLKEFANSNPHSFDGFLAIIKLDLNKTTWKGSYRKLRLPFPDNQIWDIYISFFSKNILYCLFQVQFTSKPYQETPLSRDKKVMLPLQENVFYPYRSLGKHSIGIISTLWWWYIIIVITIGNRFESDVFFRLYYFLFHFRSRSRGHCSSSL